MRLSGGERHCTTCNVRVAVPAPIQPVVAGTLLECLTQPLPATRGGSLALADVVIGACASPSEASANVQLLESAISRAPRGRSRRCISKTMAADLTIARKRATSSGVRGGDIGS